MGMMADFKIDLATIKESMPDLAKKDVSLDDELAKPLPFVDLEDLEFYNAEVQNNEQERKKFVNIFEVFLECSYTGKKKNRHETYLIDFKNNRYFNLKFYFLFL